MKPSTAEKVVAGFLIRPIEREDIEQLRLWRNQIEIRSQFIDDRQITEEQQRQWYELYLGKEDDIVWIARELSSNQPVGSVSLYDIDYQNKTAEVGRLMVAKESRGRGLGRLLMQHGVQEAFALGIQQVYLEIFHDNTVSLQINLSIGFVPCGVREAKGKYLIQLQKKKEDENELSDESDQRPLCASSDGET